MRDLFFFHLPKAGGTSISAALASRYAAARVAPNIENDVRGHRNNRGDYSRYKGFAYYSGHYGADIYAAVADRHLRVGNFRHPVERVYSLYRFFRDVSVDEAWLNDRHNAAVKAAKESSLAEFVASKDEIVVTYTSNQHARQLTGSPWALQSSIDPGAAIAAVDEMDCFYVCERPEPSIRWMDEVIGVDSVQRLNVTATPHAEAEVASVAALILDRNKIDLSMYEHAVSILQKRCERSRTGRRDAHDRAPVTDAADPLSIPAAAHA